MAIYMPQVQPLEGNITATSGTIGGCSISGGSLKIDAANVTSGTFNSARTFE